MGSDAIACQLCGVPFFIAKLGRANEGHKISIEHIAGPGSDFEVGYSARRTSLWDMNWCRHILDLVKKTEGWQRVDDDQESVIKSDFFLIEKRGRRFSNGSSTEVDQDGMNGIGFHPHCFEIFKKVSLLRLRSIDLQGLWYLRFIKCDAFFEDFPGDSARRISRELGDPWIHLLGCEYLATNPIEGVPSLPKEATARLGSEVAFPVLEGKDTLPKDPFKVVPREIISLIMDYLSSKDIANLRLCTRKVRALPNLLFRRLVLQEMPWMWEMKDMDVDVNWYNLYRLMKFCWAGLKVLRNRERIWRHAEEIVRRIEVARSKKEIED